jgi:predicted porin
MNKKLLAVAVASAFASPVFAQSTSDVTLYGRINAGVDNVKATGSTASTAGPSSAAGVPTYNYDFKDRTRVFDTGSRLGVRGTEDLGGGLRVIWQIESGFNSNDGTNVTQDGSLNQSVGMIGSRPTWVGLEGKWGNVKFGRQDVFWGNGTIAQTGPNYVNTDVPWLTGNVGRISSGINRQNDVVSYTSPTYAGANLSLYWSPDTGVGGFEQTAYNNSQAAGPGINTNASMKAITLRWAGGPFQAQFDAVRAVASSNYANVGPCYNPNLSAFSSNMNGTCNVTAGGTYPNPTGLNVYTVGYAPSIQTIQPVKLDYKLGFGYMYMPGGQISVIGVSTTNDAVTGADIYGALNLHQNALTVNWEQLVKGNILLMAEAGKQFNVTGCGTGNGTTLPNGVMGRFGENNNQSAVCDNSATFAYMLGVRYNLSKRTGVYMTWNKLINQSNAFADFWAGGYSVGTTAAQIPISNTNGTVGNTGSPGMSALSKGADPQSLAIGIMHNF